MKFETKMISIGISSHSYPPFLSRPLPLEHLLHFLQSGLLGLDCKSMLSGVDHAILSIFD